MKARIFSMINSLIFLSIMVALISCGGGKGTDGVVPPPTTTGDSGQKTDQTGTTTTTADSLDTYLKKLAEEGVIVDEATVRDQFKKYVTSDPPTAGEIIIFVYHSNPSLKGDIDKQREALCKIVNDYSALVELNISWPDFNFPDDFNPFSSLWTIQRMEKLFAWDFIPSAHAGPAPGDISINRDSIQSSLGNVELKLTPGASLAASLTNFITASNPIRDRIIGYWKIFGIDATALNSVAEAEDFVATVTANLKFKDTVTNEDTIKASLGQFFAATAVASAQKNYTWFRAYDTSFKSVAPGVATCTDNLQGNVTFTPVSETSKQGFYTKKILLIEQQKFEFKEQIDLTP